jgi:putative ATP-binding cassette transporter
MPSFSLRRLWSQAITIASPFFTSEMRRYAWLTLSMIVGMLLAINGLNILNSYTGRDFMTSLAERHQRQFVQLAFLFATVFAASTITEVMTRYVQDRFALRWRKWLTRHILERYLANRTFHRLEKEKSIDNPDQRISQDITTFTTTSLSFLVLVVNAILILSLFGGVLWSITPWLFLTMVAYAALGTTGTILLGRKLVQLDNLQLQKEADFRYALGRVREHAETVAQLGGEKDERGRLDNLLQRLVNNFRAIIRVSRNLSFFTTGYNYLPQIIPIVLVAPLYVRGEVEFGTVTQSAMAFSQSLGAFSLIVTQFQQLSAYAAVVNRLGALWRATEPTPPVAPPTGPTLEVQPQRDKVTYERVTLQEPQTDRPLCRDLSFEVSEGKRVLVTGPSDDSKVALLRATAGQWEAGTGRIIRPSRRQEIFFLPQRPPAMAGKLRDLLTYGLDHPDISDAQLIASLCRVGLESWADQPGILDMERDWPNVLTDSERQELAFARLLLANPRFAYVECHPGTLDAEHLHRIYQELSRTPITYVSVGDEPELSKYHDWRLELSEDGNWRVNPLEKDAEKTDAEKTNGRT